MKKNICILYLILTIYQRATKRAWEFDLQGERNSRDGDDAKVCFADQEHIYPRKNIFILAQIQYKILDQNICM